MDNQLHPVWQQVELMLNDGINLVPVRDRDQTVNDKLYTKKTPYTEWKKYQHQRIDRQELFNQMDQHNTTAVAMVCGTISGNLEVIDVDVKYLPGIDARLFGDLQQLYPDLLARLRVHKSPSGGCHIIYRIDPTHPVPASMPLARRPATDDELLTNPRRKTYCFIETRGQGGLCTAPPSLGYVVRKAAPIPVLTWADRCTLVELCKSYNTYIKLEKPYVPNRVEANYYDENPFADYNRRADAVELLAAAGWTMVTKRGGYLWFTKPGGKTGDVHASFNLADRYFYVFSVNTDLEGDRAYNPATILAHYNFNGDKQKTYQWLVQAGYGRIKPQVEQRIVRRAALTGSQLPANISDTGRQAHAQQIDQLNQQHPYGIFWAPDEKGVMHISRLRFQQVANDLGFKLYQDAPVQVVDGFVHRRTDRTLFDALRAYIHEQDGDLYEEIYNAFHAFYQKNAAFCITKIEPLDQSRVLQDTRHVCYKFYLNGCVIIDKERVDLVPYDQLADWLIWADKVQPRDYVHNENGGVYVDFLNKAVELDLHRDHIMRCIGYLAHDFKDETTGYFIVLSEQCPDPLQGGGSGKNLFCNLLGLTTTVANVPGSQKKPDEKFLQTWHGERIFAISDVPKDFDFRFLKELTTGNAIVKRLFKDEISVGVKDTPKFILQTNYASDIEDGGVKGRIRQIEFTGAFTRQNGVDKQYGKHFPQGWTADDYAGYDTFICQAVQKWLQNDLTLNSIELSATGWEKQFAITYSQMLLDFITENWQQWVKDGFVSNENFNKQLDEFMRENNVNPKYKPSGQKINASLKEFGNKNHFDFIKHVERLSPFQVSRGRMFVDTMPF